MFLDADEDYDEEPPVVARPRVAGRSTDDVITVEQGMDNAQRAIALFMSNRFRESRLLMEDGRDSNIYHALGFGTFAFMQAIMTMDASDLEAAAAEIKSSVAVCHEFRKKESVKQVCAPLKRGKKSIGENS
jgi:hypothetical protein